MVTGTTGGQTTIGDELGINRNHRLQTPEEIAEAVTTARKYLDWKQAALAYEAGVNERTIQRLEKGQKVNDDAVNGARCVNQRRAAVFPQES
jgi:DNA-binding XRE family transcriptional regulator